jgi:hypothetical protein
MKRVLDDFGPLRCVTQYRRRSDSSSETIGRFGWHLECQPSSKGRGKSPLAVLLSLLLSHILLLTLLSLLLICNALVAHLCRRGRGGTGRWLASKHVFLLLRQRVRVRRALAGAACGKNEQSDSCRKGCVAENTMHLQFL